MTTATETPARTITVSVKKVQRGCGWSMTTTYYLLVKEGKETLSRRQVSHPALVRSWVEAWGLRTEDLKKVAVTTGGAWKVRFTTRKVESITKITK